MGWGDEGEAEEKNRGERKTVEGTETGRKKECVDIG